MFVFVQFLHIHYVIGKTLYIIMCRTTLLAIVFDTVALIILILLELLISDMKTVVFIVQLHYEGLVNC